MTQVRIDVTQRHIDLGQDRRAMDFRPRCKSCPLALAISEALGVQCEVGCVTWRTANGEAGGDLPKEAGDFSIQRRQSDCTNSTALFLPAPRPPLAAAPKGDAVNTTTPGPWRVREFQGRRYVVDSTPDSEGKFVGQVIASRTTCPDWEANAQLIAAAPLMYHALRDALAALEAYGPRAKDDALWKGVRHTVRAALSAAVPQTGGETDAD